MDLQIIRALPELHHWFQIGYRIGLAEIDPFSVPLEEVENEAYELGQKYGRVSAELAK
jgi:hypothetical protein